MVGIGCIAMVNNLLLGESAERHSIPGKTDHCLHSGKPFLLQEAHDPVPSTHEGEDELEQRLNFSFANTLQEPAEGGIRLDDDLVAMGLNRGAQQTLGS